MSLLQERLNTFQPEFQVLQVNVALLQRLIRNAPYQLKWGNTRQVARSLRFQLQLRRQWLLVRRLVETGDAKVCLVMEAFESTVKNSRAIFTRQSYDNYEQAMDRDMFLVGYPKDDELHAVQKVGKAWNETIIRLYSLWMDCAPLLVLPDWLTIKPHCPLNGRLAYSTLLACKDGRNSRNLPDQKRLFGWNGSYKREPYKYKRDCDVADALTKVMRAIDGRIPEPHGPAPSLKSGYVILSKQNPKFKDRSRVEYPDYQRLLAGDRPAKIGWLNGRYYSTIHDVLLCGEVTRTQPSLLYYIRFQLLKDQQLSHKTAVWQKIANKIMKVDQHSVNQVPTVLTGPVERLSGDDYYAPCVYSDSNTGTHRGYVLMRRGWNDMIHVNGDLPLLADCITKLDRATQYYFQAQRDEAERKLTTNQRRAKILRLCRSLRYFEFTREDSYAVSNCQPGTATFIESLRIKSDSVSGRDMARSWMKADYIQMDRFGNVVRHLVKKQETHLQACHAALKYLVEFPVETVDTETSPTTVTLTEEHNDSAIDGTAADSAPPSYSPPTGGSFHTLNGPPAAMRSEADTPVGAGV